MKTKNFFKEFFILFILFITSNSAPNPPIYSIQLNVPEKGSLNDNSYIFYKLTLKGILPNNQENLMLRADEDKSAASISGVPYHFSDPDIYVSKINNYPKDPETSTWYCNELGNDIVAISKEHIFTNSTFYISVFCKTKCNFILNSYLSSSYKLNPFKIYGIHITPKKSMVLEFKTREQDFKHLSMQIMGVSSNQYNVYINKEIPSSSKSYTLEPAWSNGFSYDLYKDSEEYCTNCTFFILIKALDKDAFCKILITYRDRALLIRKEASIFDTIKGQRNKCYYYPMSDFPKKDSLIMNFFLFGGSMIAKIFGFDSVENKTYTEIVNTDNTYEIIGDRVLIFSQEQIEQLKKESISKNFNYIYFCLYSKIKSSYLLGIHYSSFAQQMQGLNFLNIGQSIKDYLPLNQITKYKLIDLSIESNIKIELEVLQGSPKLYIMNNRILPFFINKNILNAYKGYGYVIGPKLISEKQTIFIKNENNACHQRAKIINDKGEVNRRPCILDIIIECNSIGETNPENITNDCIYKLSTIADKSKQPINQRTTYKGLLSKDDYNDFLFGIDDENVLKFTVVLNTVSGELKLELYNIDNGEEKKILIANKVNRDFLPKIITVDKEKENLKKKNLKGKYLIRIYSTTFSLYTLYYYTYTNSTDDNIDLYSIDLNLINGQMIQDFFDKKIFKVYNYEINEGNFKDIRITVTQRNLDLNIFIYDNVNKINYEFIDRDKKDNKDNKENDYLSEFDKIINFKDYLWTNLYDSKQIIIPYSELIQKVPKDKTLLFIVIAKKYYSTKNKNNEINFLNQNTFYLGVTNNIIPLNLYENIPHQATLNHLKNFSEQKYNFIHSDNSKKLSFAINVIAGSISFQIEIKKNKIIYYKNEYINRNDFISISSQNLFKYCQNTGCEFILTISQISKESPTYMIFAHSDTERPLQLNPGILLQNQIQAGEYQFYILDFNPIEYENQNKLGNILMRYRGGKAELFMKFYTYDAEPEISNFPNEDNYDYIGEPTFAGKILHLDKELYDKCLSGYNKNEKRDNKNNTKYNNNNYNQINCRFFLTVKGTELSFYKGTRIEYSLFYSHSVLEIGQGVPYTRSITAGEINYYKFSFDANTKGIYITLYSASGDADMYVNYGNNLPSFNNYVWRSSQSQIDSIFIDLNDNYFVDNKKTSLEGLYTIMIYGYTNSTYTLTVSQGEHKIIQLIPGTPSICKVDETSKEKLCYFRVDNFANTKKLLEEDAGGLSNIVQKKIDVVDKDIHIVFSTKFIYGEGNIFAKLFKKSEIDIKLQDFPNEKNNDYTNDLSSNMYKINDKNNNNNIKRNFLKIDIEKYDPKLSPYSMLLLTVKCKDNCLFEINSAKIEYNEKFKFVDIGRENLFYISTQKSPLLLSFLYKNKEIINYEFYSFTGNAEVKIFSNESYYDKSLNQSKFEFNHIANFKIEKNIPYYNYFSGINIKNNENFGNNREIFMQITPEKSYHDLGFYVKLNYENDWTKIENFGKIVTYQLNSNVFNGYIDIFDQYENVILSIKSDDIKLTANVYVTINEITPFSQNKKHEFNYPTNQSYTYTGKTNYLTSTVSIKIDTAKKAKNGITFRIFFKVELTGDFSHRNSNLAKTIGVLVTPLVKNFQRIDANPYTIYYNSQNAKNEGKSIFDLKRVDNNDDIFVIEISACKGQFDAELMNELNYFNDEKGGKKINIDKKYQQGRLVLTGHNLKDENYFLNIIGKHENENANTYNDLNKPMEYSNEVEYLLYYFTTNKKNYVYSNVETYINPIYQRNGDIKLDMKKMKINNLEGKSGEIKNVNMNYEVVVSTDINDFSYMSSLCYLSKMKNTTKGISSYVKNEEIFISGLKPGKKYFMNIILRNPISGELFTLTPTIIENKKTNFPIGYIIIPLIIIIILVIVICYYRKEYLVTKAVLNYEQNDLRNMDNFRYEDGSSSRRGISSEISSSSKSTTKYINLEDSKI